MASEVVKYLGNSRIDQEPSNRALYDLRGDNQATDVDRWLGAGETTTNYKVLGIVAAVIIALVYLMNYKKR